METNKQNIQNTWLCVFYCTLSICIFRFQFLSISWKSFFSTSAALTYTKIYSLIPKFILKDFTEGIFIFHSHWFIPQCIPKNMAKMHIFKDYEFTPKLSFIPLYILKIFTEGFVHISFRMIYRTFSSLKHGKNVCFLCMFFYFYYYNFFVCWQYFMIYGEIKGEIMCQQN